jgi:type I restriction-modification system DNA methylase subunit
MTSVGAASFAIETAKRVWDMEPYQQVRVPDFQAGKAPVVADAIWTDYCLRPSAKNLAFLVQSVSNNSEYMVWSKRLKQWPIRGGLLISPDEIQLFHPLGVSGELTSSIVERDSLATELQGSKSHLFSPKKLAQYRTGQLSLADLEDSITRNSFSFLERQRSQLDKAFQDAIKSSLQVVRRVQTGNSKTLEGHVIRVAIAYLAARILEDKHFFESNIPTNDARKLLRATVSKTNGFFKRAFNQSIPYLEEFSPDCVAEVLQQLAVYLGDRVSFSLVDHRDVGRLYERAIKELPNSEDLNLKDKDLTDLQRHYTPVAIAERMLEMLPLERLRPEERVIFDPAAGSGSFLLAATSRLAHMSDLPDNRSQYLASHVIGNDIDPYANLVTNLRYILASESLGENAVFPAPNDFHCSNYKSLDFKKLKHKPRVVVANPPFFEDKDQQVASEFVKLAIQWLDEDSQFAFVLPQSFLAATTHGIAQARETLFESSEIIEVSEYPEKTIGVDAEQATCVILGVKNSKKKIFPLVSRSVLSRKTEIVSLIRDDGFSGFSRISVIQDSKHSWLSALNNFSIGVPTIQMGYLFYLFNGINPGKLNKNFPPEASKLDGIPYKKTWKMQWRDVNRLWIDPERIDPQKRWRRYGPQYLDGPRVDKADLFERTKILVVRKANRDSKRPILGQLDEIGLCPDNNAYCVFPADEVGRYCPGYAQPEEYPQGWEALTVTQKRLWLIGLLSSQLVNHLSSGRKSHEITLDEFCSIPLPLIIDLRIIHTTEQIIERDKHRETIEAQDDLQCTLDKLVQESYGNPNLGSLDIGSWKIERSKSTWTVSGQILEISLDKQQIKLHLTGLSGNQQEAWVPLPQELPGWALDGTVFEAQLSQDVETFEQLAQRPWALRRFRHTPRPYLTDAELSDLLEWEEDE